MVVVVLVGWEEGEVVPGVAVDGVQVGQEVPQPECDGVRPQQQGGRRLGDGVGQDELEGMHVACSFETDIADLLRCHILKVLILSLKSLTFTHLNPRWPSTRGGSCESWHTGAY